MAEHLPDIPRSNGLERSPVMTTKLVRQTRRAELDVFRHTLQMAVVREKDFIDSQTLEDVITEATNAELRVLSEFRVRAGESEAAREIIAAKLQLMSGVANRRISHRFR